MNYAFRYLRKIVEITCNFTFILFIISLFHPSKEKSIQNFTGGNHLKVEAVEPKEASEVLLYFTTHQSYMLILHLKPFEELTFILQCFL